MGREKEIVLLGSLVRAKREKISDYGGLITRERERNVDEMKQMFSELTPNEEIRK